MATTSKPRFSKSRLVEHLWARAKSREEYFGFDPGNGIAQFRPRKNDTSLDALILRAMEYGKYRCLQEIASDIEEGNIGKA